MKIKQNINVDELVDLLTAQKTLSQVDAWHSQVRALAKAITFVENDPLLAQKLLSHPKLKTRMVRTPSRVVGITGLPGAGKSSLTNLFVRSLREQNKSVAVLAVDPSSALSGGAILGDRVRMQDHFHDERVFIRSMGARGALGGVARSTRSAIRLASLLGFDYILVETVGIGQSESEIVSIADTTLLVLMPNSGDEIQLMKAGVLQLANIYVVNKSDLADASRMIQELKENVRAADPNAWNPPVLKASATERNGVDDILKAVFAHAEFEQKHTAGKSVQASRVKQEILQNAWSVLETKLRDQLEHWSQGALDDVLSGETTAMTAAYHLLESAPLQKTQASHGGIRGINHLGIVPKDLALAQHFFTKILRLPLEGSEVVADQKVEVTFLSCPPSRLELLASTADDGPIAKFLATKGAGIQHIAFEVDDLDGWVKHLQENNVALIDETPRRGAHHTRIIFIHPRATGGILVELVEERKS